MKKCNEDCFNCIYDDCILDTSECIEPKVNVDFKSVRKEYKRLYNNYYFYLYRDKHLNYFKNYYKSHKLYYKLYRNNNKNIISLNRSRWWMKRKKSNYINWYNKYLEFCNKPLIENPYKKISADEKLEVCKEKLESFKKLHGIKSKNYFKKETVELSDNEKQLKKFLGKQNSQEFLKILFSKKDSDKNVK